MSPPAYRGIVPAYDREEGLVAERGLVAWLLRRGLVWVSSSAEAWLLGWEHNPLLRHVVRRHGATTVAIFAVAAIAQVALQIAVPCLHGTLSGVVVSYVSLLLATSVATHWHTRAVKRLYNEQLRLTPLTPAELIQGLALPPLAIAVGLISPYLVVDLVAWAVIVLTRHPAGLEFLAIGVVLRVFLFFLLLPTLERIAESAAVATIGSRSGVGAAARHTLGASLASVRYLLLAVMPLVVFVAVLGLFGVVGSAVRQSGGAVFGGCLIGLVAAIWTARLVWRNFVVGRLEERSTALDAWLGDASTWPLLGGEDEPLTVAALEGWLEAASTRDVHR